MKQLVSVAAALIVAALFFPSPASSQTQEIGGYTVIRAGSGSIICLGRWIPSREAGRPGVCEGQMVDGIQLTAISSKQTADKLDQLITSLDSIDQKLTENNSQIERLIEATVNTQTAIGQQTAQVSELMVDTITTRVDALSRRVLANETFKKELEKLKQDILADLRKGYPAEQPR